MPPVKHSKFDSQLAISSDNQPKKPRHRHSLVQVAALNQLYEKSDHPSLEQRSSLAQALGMEIKTVNSWFQNKRASLKKRVRGRTSVMEPSYIPTALPTSASTSSPSTPRQFDLDEPPEDEHGPFHHQFPSMHASTGMLHSFQPSFYTGTQDQTHLNDSESISRRNRLRPSPVQNDELKKLYNINPHPSREEREELGARIGMKYESITNWFQNRRSLAKKRREDEGTPSPVDAPQLPKPSIIKFSPYDSQKRTTSPLAPSQTSLVMTLPTPVAPPEHGDSSVVALPKSAISDYSSSSRRSTPRRSVTPYGGTTMLSRPRRTRPEPYQLEALRNLYSRTSNPTIEERSLLAHSIGMDVAKVTNWFRNLRQTSRKRAKKSGHGAADDEYEDDDNVSVANTHSRVGSPSSSSSSHDDQVGMEAGDEGSEDEFQEAVTPPPFSPARPHGLDMDAGAGMGTRLYPASFADLEKTAYPGVKVEDALLLLSFAMH